MLHLRWTYDNNISSISDPDMANPGIQQYRHPWPVDVMVQSNPKNSRNAGVLKDPKKENLCDTTFP